MSPTDSRKQKAPGLKKSLEEALERLREGMEQVGRSLGQGSRQAVPIPVPTRDPRKR